MENSADGVGPFQDLLSAALDESGLADDFQDFGTAAAAQVQPAVVQSSAVLQAPHVTPISQRGMRLGTPRQQGPQQVARVVRALPAAAASPTQANVRRVLVRAVRPSAGTPNAQTLQLVNPGTPGSALRLQQAQVISGNAVRTGQVQVLQRPSGPLKIIRVTPKHDTLAASTASVAGASPASTTGQPVRTVLQVARPAASAPVTSVSLPQVQRVVQVAGGANAASPVVVNVGGLKQCLIQASQAASPVTATTVDATGVRRQIIRLDGSRGTALSHALANINPNAVKAQIVRVGSGHPSTVPASTSVLPSVTAVAATTAPTRMPAPATATSNRIPVKISNIAGQGNRVLVQQGASATPGASRTFKLVTLQKTVNDGETSVKSAVLGSKPAVEKNTIIESTVASASITPAVLPATSVTPATAVASVGPDVTKQPASSILPSKAPPRIVMALPDESLITATPVVSASPPQPKAVTESGPALTSCVTSAPVSVRAEPIISTGVLPAVQNAPSLMVSQAPTVSEPQIPAVPPSTSANSQAAQMDSFIEDLLGLSSTDSSTSMKTSAVDTSQSSDSASVMPLVSTSTVIGASAPVQLCGSNQNLTPSDSAGLELLSQAATADLRPSSSDLGPSSPDLGPSTPGLGSSAKESPNVEVLASNTELLTDLSSFMTVSTAYESVAETASLTASPSAVSTAAQSASTAVKQSITMPLSQSASTAVSQSMSSEVLQSTHTTSSPSTSTVLLPSTSAVLLPSTSTVESQSTCTAPLKSASMAVSQSTSAALLPCTGIASSQTASTAVSQNTSTAVSQSTSTAALQNTGTAVSQSTSTALLQTASTTVLQSTSTTVSSSASTTLSPTTSTAVLQNSVTTVSDVTPTMTTAVDPPKQDIPVMTAESPAAQIQTAVETPAVTSSASESKMQMLAAESMETDEDDFGLFGGTDEDLFSQALMQLQDTNVKAKEFEEYQKSKKPPTPPPPPVPASAPASALVAKTPVSVPATVVPGKPAVAAMDNVVTQPPAAANNTGVLAGTQTPLDAGISAGQFQPVSSAVAPAGSCTIMAPVDSPEPLTSYRMSSPLTLQRVNSPLTMQQTNLNLQTSGSPLVQRVNSPLTLQRGNLNQGTALSSPQLVQIVSQRSGSPLMLQRSVTVPRVLPGVGSNSGTSGVVSPLGGLSQLAMNPTKGPIVPITKTAATTSGNGAFKKELTDKDVSRLWATDDIKLKKLAHAQMLKPVMHMSPSSPALLRTEMLEEEEAEEDEELGHAETYAEYMPAKLKLGCKHPDPVVETSSLSSVEPSNIFYRLSIPENIIDCGFLSALQLEAITYAAQKHETFLPSGERAGFLIGDGAGVGKGRTIAGIIYENYLLGRKRALWLSVSNDLRVDAERDLRDIGAGKIDVHPLNKFKYGKISSHTNGSVKKGVVFATYSSLIGESQMETKYRTRIRQLLHWLGKEFDGPIIFDECHKAKNLCPVGSSKPTKTGRTVLDLQNKLPKARIVYASATGASEPRNMAYMTRLGLWGPGTPFREFSDFIQAVEKRGVGAMELVAMDMKLRGMYIARQLSFKGVSFRVEEIPVPKAFYKVYNQSVKLWVDAREKFQRAADIMDPEHRLGKSMWGQFWSAHQRFFKYLCISAKVPHCVKLAREACKNGKCVVIGLQSTGEARTLEQLEESGGELNDFVSTAKGVFQTLVEKHFPAPNRLKTNSLFGLGPSLLFDDSPAPSPKARTKRKKGSSRRSDSKRVKWQLSSGDSSSDSSDNSDSGASSMNADGHEGEKSNSESELSPSENEESDEEEEEECNPFGNGSDSDDDPWLKKKKKKAKPPKKPKEKKEKPKEVRPKKEKKKKKKKRKKSKKKSWLGGGGSSEEEVDVMDRQMDQALEAAGLKASSSAAFGNKSNNIPGTDDVDKAIAMKQELLEKIEKLDDLPPNTLDELIDQLGGPEYVAEMTGRKGRVVSTDAGVQYESRSESDVPLELLNLTEKQRFMDGEKDIAIISEAASSGISLQADRRAINQKRRVHITLELPWSADRAIQQFGRTHRSNQVSAPEYLFLISEFAGERRFASTVAKRLESLGALTHGDRRATESRDLSRFNIDNKYGRAALESIMKAVVDMDRPMIAPPQAYQGNFFHDCKMALFGVGMVCYDERFGVASLEKDYNNISKFLNRILGIEVELQNALFKYFTDTLAAVILQAKRNGRWDMGILDLGSGGETVKLVDTRVFAGTFSGTKTKTELYTITVERGTSWEKAMQIWHEHAGSEDGFYIATQARNGKKAVVLAVAMSGKKRDRERLYRAYKPNTGLQPRSETLSEIKSKYKKVYPDDAQQWWNDQYYASATTCTHAYWKGHCRKASVGLACEIGLRTRTYYVLGGSVLSVWNTVEGVLASLPGGHATRMQIIRMRTEEGRKIVGLYAGSLIPPSALDSLIRILTAEANKSRNTSNPAYGGTGGTIFRSDLTGPTSLGLGAFQRQSSSALHMHPMPAGVQQPSGLVRTNSAGVMSGEVQSVQVQPSHQRTYVNMPAL